MVSLEDVTELDSHFPFDSYRKHQKEIFLKSIQDLKDGTDVVIIEGPTGFGKSAVNIGIANYFGDAFYSSPQVKLVKQLTDDFGPDELAIDGGEGDIIDIRVQDMKEDVHFKINGEILEKLDQYSSNQGLNRSSVIRILIYTELAKRSYLDIEKKKALGVDTSDP